MTRRLTAPLAAALLATFGNVHVLADVAAVPSQRINAREPSNCKVNALHDWSGYTVRWEGPCDQGAANGSGVLRGYAKGKPTLIFYGEMQGGNPRLGVVEQPDGYLAGQFQEGKALPTEDPNVTLQAFNAAERAAQQVAARFNAKGNAASARFYAERAKRLGAQMD